MLVLFDQGTPVPIGKFLKGHVVQTTAQRGVGGAQERRIIEGG
jgi:hypothetical protein